MTMAPLSSQIFRAYDIRGIVGAGLTSEVMRVLGRSIGSEALDQDENTLIVAADARLSSPLFSRAMMDGILAAGCNVINIGVVPTPLMYFATHELDTGSGVVITGSHNPKDYNGVKIVLRRQCLADNQIRNLQTRIVEDNLHSGSGKLENRDIVADYIARISSDIRLRRKMKVVIDCGNGVAGTVAPALFEALECQVIPLFCKPDGHFPNHHPDPTMAVNLRTLISEVKAEQADLGIALDGDGDRVCLVSNAGNIIDADKMMMCFVRAIVPDNPGARVVFDVKSTNQLGRMISAANGVPVMCKSGHSFVKRKMQETGALLGGEYSAHIFFRHRWYGFDDGLYTAARFLELMDHGSCSSQSILESLPVTCSTNELFIAVGEDEKFDLMRRIEEQADFPGATINTLDGVRVDFPAGWGLVRASNTTPNLVLRFEADSPAELDNIMENFRQLLLQVDPGLHKAVYENILLKQC